jgi:hypothetical protein
MRKLRRSAIFIAQFMPIHKKLQRSGTFLNNIYIAPLELEI